MVVNIYALRYLGSWDRTPGWPEMPRETLSLIEPHTYSFLSSHSCGLGGWTALLRMSWLLTLWLWVNAKSDEICQVSFYTVKSSFLSSASMCRLPDSSSINPSAAESCVGSCSLFLEGKFHVWASQRRVCLQRTRAGCQQDGEETSSELTNHCAASQEHCPPSCPDGGMS